MGSSRRTLPQLRRLDESPTGSKPAATSSATTRGNCRPWALSRRNMTARHGPLRPVAGLVPAGAGKQRSVAEQS
jgi:hypothetical protein